MDYTAYTRFIPITLAVALVVALVSCGSVDQAQPLPVAEFQPGCTAIVDSAMEFNNQSMNADGYQWDFGNGQASDEKSPTTIYHDTGSYTVRLICRSADGVSDTAVHQVRVVPTIIDQKKLDIPYIEVQQSIWASVSEMVLRYYGHSVSQCDILNHYYQNDCCDNPVACPGGVSDQELMTNLRQFGNLEGEWQYAPLSFQQIRMEIAQGRPVIAVMEYSGYRALILVTGWYEWGTVQIIDPFHGSYEVDYDDLVRYGDYTWVRSLYCLHTTGE